MKKIQEELLYAGKWLKLKRESFQTKANEIISWETVEKINSTGCVIVLAQLKPSNRYILIRQFRHPINNTILGLPAGILNETDSVETNALRELQEETGYIGKIISISPPLKLNAAVMDMVSYFVIAEVDESLPENQQPVQALEPEEVIETALIAANDVNAFLLSEQQKGNDISAALWYIFAIHPQS